MPAKKPFNPFYAILVVVGVAFVVTACAYGVLTVKMIHPAGAEEVRTATGGLLPLVHRFGVTALLVELGMLTLLTVAAIGTDDYWSRPAAREMTNDE
jgi:hypothetical protein